MMSKRKSVTEGITDVGRGEITENPIVHIIMNFIQIIIGGTTGVF